MTENQYLDMEKGYITVTRENKDYYIYMFRKQLLDQLETLAADAIRRFDDE